MKHVRNTILCCQFKKVQWVWLVWAWFTSPIDIENMKERIRLNGEYEEYAIHDYKLPFDVGNIHQLVKLIVYAKW